MEDLRVPKRRVSAEVLLPGGAARRITLFLAEAAPAHTGPERPTDLLNGGDDFVPAFDEEARAMTFLNRAGLAVVRAVVALGGVGAVGGEIPRAPHGPAAGRRPLVRRGKRADAAGGGGRAPARQPVAKTEE